MLGWAATAAAAFPRVYGSSLAFVLCLVSRSIEGEREREVQVRTRGQLASARLPINFEPIRRRREGDRL